MGQKTYGMVCLILGMLTGTLIGVDVADWLWMLSSAVSGLAVALIPVKQAKERWC